MTQFKKKHELSTSMITEIGLAAGEIWRALDERDELSVEELVEITGCSKELILMAAGWLAREAHITIEDSEGEYWMQIRTKKS